MNNLLELIQEKANNALTDYNRFMQKPNVEEYKKNALLCKGQYEAYMDLYYHIKTHKEEYYENTAK